MDVLFIVFQKLISVEKDADPNRKEKDLKGYHQIKIFNKNRENEKCQHTEKSS